MWGGGGGEGAEGNLVMATGLVSATKFGAAAFGGLRGPGGGRTGSAAPEGSGGGRGPGRAEPRRPPGPGSRRRLESGHCLVVAFPQQPGGAPALPGQNRGVRGGAGLPWGPSAAAPDRGSEPHRASVVSPPPPFLPRGAPACSGLSERGRSAPPRGAAAVWGTGGGGGGERGQL